MANTLSSTGPHSLAPFAALLLAVAVLLAPLAAGYAWVSGGHAGESHVHRHHLMEKLAPNSHHHPSELPPPEGDAGLEGGGPGLGVIMHGFPLAALTAVMAPAFIPDLASYFESATAALLAGAAATFIVSYHALALLAGANRPQAQPNPLDRPPTA